MAGLLIGKVKNPNVAPILVAGVVLHIAYIERRLEESDEPECMLIWNNTWLSNEWGGNLPGWQYLHSWDGAFVEVSLAECGFADVLKQLVMQGHSVVEIFDFPLKNL